MDIGGRNVFVDSPVEGITIIHCPMARPQPRFSVYWFTRNGMQEGIDLHGLGGKLWVSWEGFQSPEKYRRVWGEGGLPGRAGVA